MRRWPWELSLLALLCGCEDPLEDAQLLEEPRVLGVRVSAADGRAALVPGESAQLEILLAGPQGLPADAHLTWRLCESGEAERGVPICVGEPLIEQTLDFDGSALAMEVPSSVAGESLVLLGAFCLEGEPRLLEDPLDWSCSNGRQPLRFSFEPRVATDGFDNLNPDLADLSIAAGDTLLALDTTASLPDCSGDAVLLDPQQARHLELALPAAARQMEARETLQLSHFATAGVWQRHFTFVEPAQSLEVTLDFAPPEGAGPVKQYLVVRDGRGGVSWASVSFCVE